MEPRLLLMILGFGAGSVLSVLGVMLLMIGSKSKAAKKRLQVNGDDISFDDVSDDPFTPQEESQPAQTFAAPQVTQTSTTPAPGVVLCNATPYLQQIFGIFMTEDLTKFNDIEVLSLAQSHASIAQNYRNSGVKRRTELVQVVNQQDILHEQANQWEYVTSEVMATVYDQIIDISTNEVVGGDGTTTYNVKYILLFARPAGEQTFALMKVNLVQ